jgi:phage tail-like protein
MASYQRGMRIAAKVTARSIRMYTRRVSVKTRVTSKSTSKYARRMKVAAKTSSKSWAKGARGMTSDAVSSARGVPMGTRGITESKEMNPPSWAKGTRGMLEEMSHKDPNPWGNYYFALFIGDAEVAHFQECSGLKNSCEVYPIQEGGLNSHVHKRPGQSKWENITLKYATNASMSLLHWRDDYLMDKFTDGLRIDAKKAQGAIVLKANDGTVLRRYEFTNAWPVSWEGPSMNSGGSALAIETIEIAHDGLVITEGS